MTDYCNDINILNNKIKELNQTILDQNADIAALISTLERSEIPEAAHFLAEFDNLRMVNQELANRNARNMALLNEVLARLARRNTALLNEAFADAAELYPHLVAHANGEEDGNRVVEPPQKRRRSVRIAAYKD
jgi:acyl carrier protein phosphodiesterase